VLFSSLFASNTVTYLACIRLIVVAVVVELVSIAGHLKCDTDTHMSVLQGEILARLVVHATIQREVVPQVISKADALRTLERMMLQS